MSRLKQTEAQKTGNREVLNNKVNNPHGKGKKSKMRGRKKY